jgi:hypothetical protein
MLNWHWTSVGSEGGRHDPSCKGRCGRYRLEWEEEVEGRCSIERGPRHPIAGVVAAKVPGTSPCRKTGSCEMTDSQE